MQLLLRLEDPVQLEEMACTLANFALSAGAYTVRRELLLLLVKKFCRLAVANALAVNAVVAMLFQYCLFFPYCLLVVPTAMLRPQQSFSVLLQSLLSVMHPFGGDIEAPGHDVQLPKIDRLHQLAVRLAHLATRFINSVEFCLCRSIFLASFTTLPNLPHRSVYLSTPICLRT